MELSEQQFDKLVKMIDAKIAAHAARNSAGPHVAGLRDEAEHCEIIARLVLVGGVVFE